VVVFIKDSRDSNNLDSDEDTVANERLQGVVGDITTSFSSPRHNSQLITSVQLLTYDRSRSYVLNVVLYT